MTLIGRKAFISVAIRLSCNWILKWAPKRTEKESKGTTEKGENDCRSNQMQCVCVRVLCAVVWSTQKFFGWGGGGEMLVRYTSDCGNDTARRYGLWNGLVFCVRFRWQKSSPTPTSTHVIITYSPKYFRVCACAGQGCAMLPGCREFGDMFYV